MKIEIKNRYDGALIYACEIQDTGCKDKNLGLAVVKAVKNKVNLEGADLKGADLRSASLEGVNLKCADLDGAILEGVDLEGVNLKGANLKGAYLRDAYLEYANLTGANLVDAYLTGAYFEDAILVGVDLMDANLEPIKRDMFDVLRHAIPEIPMLKQAIITGKINGSVYEGECACLMGTIEKSARFNSLNLDIRDSSRPIERFFLAIKKGDTPETNQVSAIVLSWIEEFEKTKGE